MNWERSWKSNAREHTAQRIECKKKRTATHAARRADAAHYVVVEHIAALSFFVPTTRFTARLF